MTNTVTAFTTAMTVANLWEVVSGAVPILVIAITFALGYRIYRKLTNGISKTKVKQ